MANEPIKPWTMNNIIDDEAPKDPGIEQITQGYTEKDYEGHRAHTVFVGVHVPGKSRHAHRRHKHPRKENDDKTDVDRPRSNSLIVQTPVRRRLSVQEDGETLTPPAQRVQFILGEDVDDVNHESHPLFSEMEELVRDGDELEWKETARWVKFEEDVEEGGNRWSKPHVATLSLHSLFELRSLLLNGTVMLDMEATTLEQIADLVCDNMVNAGTLPTDAVDKVRDALLRRHRHQYEREKKGHGNHLGNNMRSLPIIRSLADIGRNHSSSKSLRVTTDDEKERNLKPSQSSLLKFFNNNKDQRGSYLTVPTGDMASLSHQQHSHHQHTGILGVQTLFHLGSSSTPNIIPPPASTTATVVVGGPAGMSSTTTTASTSNNKVDDQTHNFSTTTVVGSGFQQNPSTGSGGMLKHDNYGGNFLSVPGKNNSSPFLSGDDMVKSPSNMSMQRNTSGSELQSDHKQNTHFMRKIPPGAEASNILVGEVDFLEKTLSGFIRLSQATIMGDLTEVPVPTRFVFILLGPPGMQSSYHEIGRAMATLMSDEIFHEVAYRAKKRDHLLSGIDEFLDAVTVLPPGEWDPTIRIEPPAAIPSQEERKHPKEKIPKNVEDEEEVERRIREETGLTRSGRLFGGLMNDLKRKAPFYLSDFKDAFAIQCVASWIFLYFACLSPIITFGGLLSAATGKNMAAMESLVSGFVCGMGYGFFSGQPLTILGSTGPVLVFETIVYNFCDALDWEYISFRFWIGTWIAVILLILVAIDASALVCYITRFTEENFATLIAFIFIYKAFENVLKIRHNSPLDYGPNFNCQCVLTQNSTRMDVWDIQNLRCDSMRGTLIGPDCDLQPKPNVFLMSVVLFLGTFTISIILKDFKTALFFTAGVRKIISDFAVIIAIVSMSVLDYSLNVATPKLEVPHEFKPTKDGRGWIVMPFNGNPWWSAIIAVLPALLGTILIFMDQQITSVIINRKENKLKKGCGYHLDLFVLCILIQICSTLGIPWFVAATVLSITHVNSLKLETDCAAPGERPQFLGVREQRVTHIMIFFMIGSSVMLTPILCHIPMPVLYGVFLYMGSSSLKGLQFFDRILIFFMPQKHQPDFMFLRQVPIKRVHIFTAIQLGCLSILWTIKSFEKISILFPLMLVVMIGIRKSLDCFFTRRELKILDDIMPEMTRRAAADDDQSSLEDGSVKRDIEEGGGPSAPPISMDKKPIKNGENPDDPPPYSSAITSTSGITKKSTPTIQIPLSNGNILKLPLKSINISEEVNKSGIWRQVNEENGGYNPKMSDNNNQNVPQKRNKPNKNIVEKKIIINKNDISPIDDKRLSTMAEEEEIMSAPDEHQQKKSTSQSNLINSQKNSNSKNPVKEFWIGEQKINPKDVGDAAETPV